MTENRPPCPAINSKRWSRQRQQPPTDNRTHSVAGQVHLAAEARTDTIFNTSGFCKSCNVRIFHKGLLLIAIPMIGQFVFALILLGAHRTAEDLAWKDQHYRTQTQELMSVMVLVYRSVMQLSAFGYAQDQKFLESFDRQYLLLSRKAELLALLDKGTAHGEALGAQTSLKRAMDRLHELRQILAMKKEVFGADSHKALIGDVVIELSQSLSSFDRLIAVRSRSIESDTKAIEQNRWIFLLSIIVGFSINMIFSALLLFMYSKDFAARFNIIVKNTELIPLGKPLQKRLTGNDEIARLDHVIHDMDRSLKTAEAKKQEFMSMVSHDMRSPLTSVLLTVEAASYGMFGEMPQKLQRKLVDVESIIRRLCRLVNDILDGEKMKAGKFELTLVPVDIDTAISAVLDELRPVATASNVNLQCKPAGLVAVADKDRMIQVLANLVANAIKFSPPDTDVIVGSRTLDSMVQILVRDFGPGVPANYRRTIFLPFEQIADDQRPKAGTTGLGLTICKNLIELHGGTIGVDDPQDFPGHFEETMNIAGSVFWFTLPQHEEEDL
ncbi:MAG: HAMP domain-containing histidine kinase [Candidatus Obscuribacterales bacterium]|nr:HAMP domain-containing histidine kinase [Candidatus Obscuribacterales bacterium]